MIRRFRHKGLRALHQRGDTSGVRADHVARLHHLLGSLDVACTPYDMDRPANRLHKLKGGAYAGYWSISVSGNWRIIFRFEGTDADRVDYLNYH